MKLFFYRVKSDWGNTGYCAVQRTNDGCLCKFLSGRLAGGEPIPYRASGDEEAAVTGVLKAMLKTVDSYPYDLIVTEVEF